MPIPVATPAPAVKRLLADVIQQELRELIVSGRLAPGEALSDESLAEYFSASRTPVREALNRLSAEGLVVVWPQRGTFVSELDPVKVMECLRVLTGLIAYVIGETVDHLTDEDRAELSALAQSAAAQMGDDPEDAAMRDLFTSFSMVFFRRLDSKVFIEVRDRVVDHVRRGLIAYQASVRRVPGELFERISAVVDHAVSGQTEQAVRSMHEYSRLLRETLERHIDPTQTTQKGAL